MKIGLALFVIACLTLLAAGQISQSSSVVPLIAENEVHRSMTLQDGSLLDSTRHGMFYRDSAGRTRAESGPRIVITDPVAKLMWVLDQDRKIAEKIPQPVVQMSNGSGKKADLASLRNSTPNVQARTLGQRTIEGLNCNGQERISVIPADGSLGNTRPLQTRTEIWEEQSLHLPVLISSDNPLTGKSVQQYKNIRVGAEPDPSLFRVPANYQVIQR